MRALRELRRSMKLGCALLRRGVVDSYLRWMVQAAGSAVQEHRLRADVCRSLYSGSCCAGLAKVCRPYQGSSAEFYERRGGGHGRSCDTYVLGLAQRGLVGLGDGLRRGSPHERFFAARCGALLGTMWCGVLRPPLYSVVLPGVNSE